MKSLYLLPGIYGRPFLTFFPIHQAQTEAWMADLIYLGLTLLFFTREFKIHLKFEDLL